MLDHSLWVAAVEADLLDGGQLELGPVAAELEIVMREQLDLGHLVAELVLVLLLLLQSVAFELVLAAFNSWFGISVNALRKVSQPSDDRRSWSDVLQLLRIMTLMISVGFDVGPDYTVVEPESLTSAL
jgi:hypothetical protein